VGLRKQKQGRNGVVGGREVEGEMLGEMEVGEMGVGEMGVVVIVSCVLPQVCALVCVRRSL